MNVLITGGAGFIGSHLTDYLLSEGHQVSVIDDCSTGSADNLERARQFGNQFRFEQQSVELSESIRGWALEADWIFHLAAAVGVRMAVEEPVHTLRTNLTATERILDLAAMSQARLFVASTSEVYGKSKKDRFSESDDLLLGPPSVTRWGYACSKAFDEFLTMAFARQKNLDVVIGRFFNTVGLRQSGRWGMVMPRFIDQAVGGHDVTVFGDGQQTRCFCHVSDAIHQVVRIMHHPQSSGQVFNIGNDEEVSIQALAMQVVDISGSGSRIVHVPYEEAYDQTFEDIVRRKPDLTKIRSITGPMHTTAIADIIKQLVNARTTRDVDGGSPFQKGHP